MKQGIFQRKFYPDVKPKRNNILSTYLFIFQNLKTLRLILHKMTAFNSIHILGLLPHHYSTLSLPPFPRSFSLIHSPCPLAAFISSSYSCYLLNSLSVLFLLPGVNSLYSPATNPLLFPLQTPCPSLTIFPSSRPPSPSF